MVSSAEGINFYLLYFSVNINWTLEFKGIQRHVLGQNAEFSVLLLQQSEISYTSRSISTELKELTGLTNTSVFYKLRTQVLYLKFFSGEQGLTDDLVDFPTVT